MSEQTTKLDPRLKVGGVLVGAALVVLWYLSMTGAGYAEAAAKIETGRTGAPIVTPAIAAGIAVILGVLLYVMDGDAE